MDSCPYCGSPVQLDDSIIIYGTSYGKVWICSQYPKCDAYVGCHKGTSKPLGRLANAELRYWKKRAHGIFDPLWQSKRLDRKECYKFLQVAMKMTSKEAHIGKFGVEECKRLVHFMQSGSYDNLVERWKKHKVVLDAESQ